MEFQKAIELPTPTADCNYSFSKGLSLPIGYDLIWLAELPSESPAFPKPDAGLPEICPLPPGFPVHAVNEPQSHSSDLFSLLCFAT